MRIPHTSTAIVERDPRLQKRGNPVMNETPNPVRHRSELFAAIVGDSAAIAAVKDLTARIMNRKWRYVMISGEPGTGKEMLARALHTHSFREFRPFVECRCSEFASEDVEKLLFGIEATSKENSYRGLLESAENGTLFIEEIGKFSVPIQGKLLKVLEQQRFRRIDGTDDIPLNARIIATTSQNLSEELKSGHFLSELYYRLNVANIFLPPLKERENDMLVLAEHFLQRFAAECDSPVREFSADAQKMLERYPWPGNIRELRYVTERLTLLSDRRIITAEMLQEVLFGRSFPNRNGAVGVESIEIPPKGMSLQEGEKHLIDAVLRLNNWNKRRSSQILGISRPRLDRKIEKYGLSPEQK